ncbi:MAG: thioredoxin domain-containing protein [Cytophagaceae bacterium]|nr:thioredoxin domain-containing protein [Cytophagaceae bacterium]MBL0303895.1 thioredoxin domain-containing protein [Cytophagaceae bacterium]MBL0326709.1 thioredoxin domain-containing protein [Cytophagaceae bacterium]
MNKLAQETSPYLLQHKDNPVDWFPWGDEALNKAQTEDKPIILSIGYSSCHWCHVMEHECFEDFEVAEIMNHYFVCIKLDREERPDIDAIYMDALQNMGLRGGWPLNVFLMPDTKPFYGGTYFPKKNWINLLLSVVNSFKTQREKLQESADGFARSLNIKDSEKYFFGQEIQEIAFSGDEINQILNKIQESYDTIDGGMKRSPKFPMPTIWKMLLDAIAYFPNEKHINQLKLTIERIILGGIFDHISGGWCRYSTDDKWKIPHFEKMLYDNGQLLSLTARANLYFKENIGFKQLTDWALSSTVAWLEHEMSSAVGGFFAALDADSEGEEGKYYVWEEKEIKEALAEKSDYFIQTYKVTAQGNWEENKNILHLENYPENFPTLVESHKILKNKLLNRVRPGLDNKILCGWNALVLNGLVETLRFTDVVFPIDIVKNGFEFFENNFMVKHGDLLRLKHQAGHKDNLAFLEDYSSTIAAFINYYQYCFEEKYLNYSLQLTDYLIDNFYDDSENLFYFTDKNAEKLIARKKEIFDNVIPSSNSMMAHNLNLLGRIFEKESFLEISETMFKKVKPLLIQDPQWLSNWVALGMYFSAQKHDIVVVGPDYKNILKELQKARFLPNAIFFGTNQTSNLPAFEGRLLNDNQTRIYICIDKTCLLPLTNLNEAIEILKQ